MNENMKKAWAEISKMLVEPTPIELDVFLRTWQRAIQAEREECAQVCDGLADMHAKMNQWGSHKTADTLAQAIRARGQA